ncbi:glycoside hydrolase superfamily [Aspergillus desertorum]
MAHIFTRAAHLKDRYEGFRINIVIGGWVSIDPPTAARWSDMVAGYEYTTTFVDSLVEYLRQYGLDGVHLDWESPVADDRGGAEKDYQNLVVFCARLRERLEEQSQARKLH